MANPGPSPSTHPVNTPFSIWLEGLRVGTRSLLSDPRVGLERLILPVSYWRYAEFGYVARRLDCPAGARLLDVGSPKDLALFLARRLGHGIVATDILPAAIIRSQRGAVAVGIAGEGPGRVGSEVRDGRKLPYADNTFDAAYSVSVLEHIPDGGDTATIRELVRVVRPGGVVIVTTPYDATYRETFVDRPVYERSVGPAGGPVFFERHYDSSTLASRLLDPSGARLVDLQLWGEPGVRAERRLSQLGSLRVLLSPLEPLLAAVCLHRTDGETGRAMAAFFTLQKP